MLKIYNTLTRKKEIFKPLKKGRIKMFVCGITSYDFSHIGHARTYIIFDMIVKYLRQKGYDIFYLQNITDIDDKIIERAKEEKLFWKDLSKKFEREYLKDMKALNINSVTKYARATAHIKEIISQVKRLLKKGFAYQIKDGVYYDISKFKDYGKLSKRTILQAEDAISRIDQAKRKRNKGDFCLWKFSKPGEPKWPSPFGLGRPGWHIEDTAIAEKYFGPQYDIHGGAKDLIFPHHEAEIAQMEAISEKKPMVKYWLHSGFLTVKGVKMAKSLGNFITIKDFLKNHSTRILRFFVIKNHYRSPINYNEKEIAQVKKQLERIDEFIDKLKTQKLKIKGQRSKPVRNLILKTREQFEEAMDDDFNTPRALGLVFNLIKKTNKLIDQNKLKPEQAKVIYNSLMDFDQVLGVLIKKTLPKKLPPEIKELIEEREQARGHQDWAKADRIRREIKKRGYQVEDTAEGPKIKPN